VLNWFLLCVLNLKPKQSSLIQHIPCICSTRNGFLNRISNDARTLKKPGLCGVVYKPGIGCKSKESTFEQELVPDMIELITVFSAGLYGSRSQKNQKLIEGMAQVVKEVQ